MWLPKHGWLTSGVVVVASNPVVQLYTLQPSFIFGRRNKNIVKKVFRRLVVMFKLWFWFSCVLWEDCPRRRTWWKPCDDNAVQYPNLNTPSPSFPQLFRRLFTFHWILCGIAKDSTTVAVKMYFFCVGQQKKLPFPLFREIIIITLLLLLQRIMLQYM